MDTEQTVVFDGHMHVYPAYRLPDALGALFANLGRCAPTAGPAPVCAGLLVDTAASPAYRARIGQPRLKQVGAFILQPTDEAGAMAVRDEDRILGYVIAGRQFVTAERLEVLSLTADPELADGTPLAPSLATIRAAGGVPVLCWSPGKWSGVRGQLVRTTIEAAAPTDFLLGDTSLRPDGWPEPALLKLGRTRGFRIVQGTDALPFAGEERRLGTCATRVRGPWDPARPVTSMRRLLTAPDYALTPAGRRLSLAGFAARWTRQMVRKYARKHEAPLC